MMSYGSGFDDFRQVGIYTGRIPRRKAASRRNSMFVRTMGEDAELAGGLAALLGSNCHQELLLMAASMSNARSLGPLDTNLL